jgi:hypothetical protein
MKTFNDFIDRCCEQIPLPEADVRRTLLLHLDAAGISTQDVEIYINYPELTQRGLARWFSLSEPAICRTLNRVRKAWPALLHDPDVNQHGSVSPRNVLQYNEWMDPQILQKF